MNNFFLALFIVVMFTIVANAQTYRKANGKLIVTREQEVQIEDIEEQIAILEEHIAGFEREKARLETIKDGFYSQEDGEIGLGAQ